MNRRFLSLVIIAASVPALSASAETFSTSTEIKVGPNLRADGSVNDQPAQFQLQSNGPATVILNPEASLRFGLKGGLFGGQAKIGPIALKGRTAKISLGIAGQRNRRQVAWFDRMIVPDFDGILGPMAVPQDIVVFQLRPARASEQRFDMPLSNQGGAVGTFIDIGDQRVLVQWDLSKPHNTATAAAGAALAVAYDGQFSGKASQAVIAFGIERPVRALVLSGPFTVGPLSLDKIITRTSDYGDTSGIADADADQNEIVVTARGKKTKVIRTVQIGLDTMKGCSSLTFNKVKMTITISCGT